MTQDIKPTPASDPRLDEWEVLVVDIENLLDGNGPSSDPYHFVREAAEAIPALIRMVRVRVIELIA